MIADPLILGQSYDEVEGVYQNGQIELTDVPSDVSDRAQVLVTFLDSGKIDPVKLRQLIEQLETIAGISKVLKNSTRDLLVL
ncbi:MAG: hypothetical protein ABI262_21630 [Microcoleus sp.]|jgi:hypothetical protein